MGVAASPVQTVAVDVGADTDLAEAIPPGRERVANISEDEIRERIRQPEAQHVRETEICEGWVHGEWVPARPNAR